MTTDLIKESVGVIFSGSSGIPTSRFPGDLVKRLKKNCQVSCCAESEKVMMHATKNSINSVNYIYFLAIWPPRLLRSPFLPRPPRVPLPPRVPSPPALSSPLPSKNNLIYNNKVKK